MKKWITVLVAAMLLNGCANNKEIEALKNEIQGLKTQSSTELEKLRADIQTLRNQGEGVFEGKKIQSRNRISYFARQNTPFTGVAVWELPEKEKKEATYKDGKKDGLETWWYASGQKKFEGTYMAGKPNGLFTRFYRDGKKSYERTFRDQKLLTAISWKPNGQKCTDTNFLNGNGRLCQYHENGLKEYETTFRDGKKISQKKWDESGKPVKIN